MGQVLSVDDRSAMASRWRRRRMCVLVAGRPAPVALRQVSAAGAFVETSLRPSIGQTVELQHPDAGIISGKVSAHDGEGIRIAFSFGESSVAFALAAIASDMTRPRS